MLNETKDYMFFNGETNEYIGSGAVSTKEVIRQIRSYLKEVNRIRRMLGLPKITKVLAHETYTGIEEVYRWDNDNME